MKIKILTVAVVLHAIITMAAFGQEQLGLAASIKSLVDSGTIATVSVVNSIGNPFQISTSVRTWEVKNFSISTTLQLLLEVGSTKFAFDLTRVAVFSYDSRSKSLIIWMI